MKRTSKFPVSFNRAARQSVLQLAHKLRKVTKGKVSWQSCLQQSWASVALKLQMQDTDERGVFFRYKKEDGSERWAQGTRTLSHVPDDQLPHNNTVDGVTVRYYDLMVGGWRSFRADRLIATA